MTSRPENVTLKFSKPVANMLVQARVFQGNIVVDQAALAAVDPGITVLWNDDFLAEIDAAEAMPQPASATANLAIATENLNLLMEQATNSVQELYYYVALAWPGSKPHLNAYGRNEYESARKSHNRMVDLMTLAEARIAQETAELNAVGYTAAKITAFGTLLANLQSKNVLQEDLKGNRGLVTEAYYGAMNGVWDRMARVNRAAMIAFQNDSARRDQYLLYEGTPGDLVFTLTVGVPPAAVYHHFLEAMAPTQIIRAKKLEGNGAAWMCFTTADALPCDGPQHIVQDLELEFVRSQFGAGDFLRVIQDGTNQLKLRVTVPVM